jgi:photosystem II stability/assembly factor-like uncharacterized protein
MTILAERTEPTLTPARAAGIAREVRRAMPNPCPQAGYATVPGVAAADPQHLDAACVSGGAAGSARYQLYGSTDGGHSWRRAGTAHVEESGFYGMADNAHGVLLLAVASGDSTILRTINDGATFTNTAVKTAPGGIGWHDLGFTTSTQAVAVLDGSALYLNHDAGRSFQPVSS